MPLENARSRIGAVLCALLALAFALAPLAFSDDSSLGSLWLQFIGGFHPVLLHLPIGIVFLAVTLQMLRCWLPSIDRNILAVAWLLSALTASLSFATGFLLGSEGGFDRSLIVPHLWSAGIFTALCWACLALALLRSHAAFSVPLQFACILSVMTAGHYGGLMVHGDPLAAAPWKPENQPLVFLPEIGDPVNAYHDVVQPILQAKCVSCHGHAKQRGGLRLDSLEFALLGGSHGPILVPKRADQSELMKSLTYPISSDKHMPPQGKPQLNALELSVIKWWIDQGANDQLAFTRQEAPEPISPFLVANYRLLPDPKAERLEKEREAARRAEQKQRRSELAARLDQLPSALRQHFLFSSSESDELVFRCLTSPREFENDHLKQVSDLLVECAAVDLSSTAVTSEALEQIAFSQRLRVLKLNKLPLTSQALACLSGATAIQSLSLFGSPLSDDATDHLSSLKSLTSLYVGETNLSVASISSLQMALPDCEVVGSIRLKEIASKTNEADDNTYSP